MTLELKHIKKLLFSCDPKKKNRPHSSTCTRFPIKKNKTKGDVFSLGKIYYYAESATLLNKTTNKGLWTSE